MTGSEPPLPQSTHSTFGPLDLTGEPVQMLIITGMSGAGRSTAANVLEDAGWYVVDNLPPQMLPMLAEIAGRARSALHKVATVIDVRGGTFFEDMDGALETLRHSGVNVKVMFLDASDEALVRRFESVRRPHPLQGEGRILDGIQAERSQVGEIRGAADLVVDTSSLNVHQLSARIAELFSGEEGLQPLRLTVMSFGFKYGIPVDADHVVDVRFLPNPFWVPELRSMTGRDEPVSQYVLEQAGAREFLLRYVHALEPVIEGYRRENRSYVTIAVGCTGGKHRSVAITEAIVKLLAQYMVKAHAAHRDLGRE